MQLFLLICALFGISSSAWAAPQFLCGSIDRSTRVIYHSKSPNQRAAQRGAVRACQTNGHHPGYCSAAYCQLFDDNQGRPSRAPRYRQPSRAEEEAKRAALEAIEEAKRQQREREIDDLLRREREDRLQGR